MHHFQVKTRVTRGEGALQSLRELSGQRVLIVTDSFMAKTVLMTTVLDILKDAEVSVFDEVLPDPTLSLVAAGVQRLIEFKPDAVLAVGGGSPIDTAKAVYEVSQHVATPGKQGLWVIPTTSGSGSEVTSFAIITDDANRDKLTLLGEDMIPARAILDPEAVRSAPAAITAATGMDALSHCYEAILSTNAWAGTDALAEKAIDKIYSYLPRAFRNGEDMEARSHMHDAACLAGMAFENAGLGIVHSMSHALGARFHKSHGVINTLVMPSVLNWLAGDLDAGLCESAIRLAQIGRRIGSLTTTDKQAALYAIEAVCELRDKLGLPRNIAELGLDQQEYLAAIPDMCQAAMRDACTATSPRQPTADDIAKLYHTLV